MFHRKLKLKMFKFEHCYLLLLNLFLHVCSLSELITPPVTPTIVDIFALLLFYPTYQLFAESYCHHLLHIYCICVLLYLHISTGT